MGDAGHLISALIASILALSNCAAATAQGERADLPGRAERQNTKSGSQTSGTQDPQALYLRAWTLVNDTYFDRSFNNQNWSVWKHKYDGQLKSTEDASRAIKAMLDSLNNPHTKLIERGLSIKQDPNLFGIGLKLAKKAAKDPAVILEATPGSPAQIVGVHPADVLIAIDGKNIAGKPLDEIAALLRGPERTKTTITVARKGAMKKFIVERAASRLEDLLCTRTLPGGIGYIRLDGMSSRGFIDAVKPELQKIDTTSGTILDLRNNSGGLLANALEVSMLFVPKGKLILTVVDNAGYKTSQVQSKQPVYKGRLFVLINHDTGAGAEIIAAALKESAGAQIIGVPSSGNATLDAINPLGDGLGITLSIAEWQTPNGNSILNQGIKPDAEIVVAENDTASKGPWWLADEPSEPGAPNCADVQLMKALSLAKDASQQSSGH